MLRTTVFFILWIALSFCADQDILTILKQQSGVDTFTSYLEKFPALVDQLNDGNFSVLVPNDDAFSVFAANESDVISNDNALEALLQYHVAQGVLPSTSFGLPPQFPATLLSNANYTNVTGGQRVEITSENGAPTILTGVKAASHVVQPDIFYIGGLIQIVDAVLTIPVSVPATITRAGLNDLVALLNKGGWLTPDSQVADIVNGSPDLTIFGPNDPRFGASFTGWDGLSEADLLTIFKYSTVGGAVLYSTELKNNSQLNTLQNLPLTITTIQSDIYADSALITTRDYLTSNGVLQVLDSPLNPNTTDARPGTAPSSGAAKSGSKGLSTAGTVGVGVGVGAVILGAGLVAAISIRTRRRRRRIAGTRLREVRVTHGIPEADGGPPPPFGAHELDTKAPQTTATVFGVPSPPPLEIDGRERSRISITFQGETPRHLGFQARY